MYRIGIIGHTGHGDYGHGIDRVWLDMAGCQIVAVADADPDGLGRAIRRLNAPQGYTDYRAMLDQAKPDIVSICPRWIDQHRDMVVAAAQRGVHIYMEKPLARTLAEADEMVAACTATKVKLAIAFQTRYSPKLPIVRQLIESGAIGQVLELRARGKEDHRGGGEDLWVLGSHLLNLIHYLGGPPAWCFARVLQGGRPICQADVRPGNEGIGPLAGDTIHAMYGLDDGVAAYFGSRRNAGRARFAVRIYGSEGILEMRTGYLTETHYLPDASWSPGASGARWLAVSSAGVGKPEPLTEGDAHAGNQAACADLIAAIKEDRQPEASVYEARMTVEMTAAVFESQRIGAPVTLPLENRSNPLRNLP